MICIFKNTAKKKQLIETNGEYILDNICTYGMITEGLNDEFTLEIDFEILAPVKKELYDLITEEVGLGPLIERAIQQMEEEKDSLLKNTGKIDENKEEEELFNYKTDAVLKDVDFDEFTEFEEEQEELNDKVLKELMDT